MELEGFRRWSGGLKCLLEAFVGGIRIGGVDGKRSKANVDADSADMQIYYWC